MQFKISALLIVVLLFLAGCASDSGSGPPVQQGSQNASPLRELAQARGKLIGAAVSMDAFGNDEEYRQALAREFNIVTPENVMKFDAIQPQEDVFTFDQGDALVKFAREHKMQVHGHTLVWHRALPAWIESGSYNREQLMQILKEHITTLVKHYKGQISMWDVVNEAIDDNVGQFRSTIWHDVIGPEYIDMAFRWAHEADPQAQLYYNDYNGEGRGVKSDAIYNLVKGLKERGVPIHGVGLQMHISSEGPPPTEEVLENMQRLTALGLKVQITEMDVKLQNDPRTPQERLKAQAEIYGAMLGACLQVKDCDAFIMWGFTDKYTWIPIDTGVDDQPLIFDKNYRPKPAYEALAKMLTA